MSPAKEQAYLQIIQQQEETIRQQAFRIAELERQVRELTAQVARLSKNSSNSSKPPSSDITKPPRPPGSKRGKRKLGGQPGHARHERQPFPADEVDKVVDYHLDCCQDPNCRGPVWMPPRPPEIIQQVEIPQAPAQVTEHRGHPAGHPSLGQAIGQRMDVNGHTFVAGPGIAISMTIARPQPAAALGRAGAGLQVDEGETVQ
jgi:hypothetical protein